MLTLEFLEDFKEKTQSAWENHEIQSDIYGFQIQKNSKWLPGLTSMEIAAYEDSFDCTFPDDLKLLLSCLNGLDKPAINVFGNDGTPHTFIHSFYSYSRDVELVSQMISYTEEDRKEIFDALFNEEGHAIERAGKFFPIYGHRYVLCSEDQKQSKVFSIVGSDAICYGDNLQEYLENEFAELLK